MRILYIAEKIPYPIYQDGGTLMNYHLLKGIKKNHTIDLITFSQQNIPVDFIKQLCSNYYSVNKNKKLSRIHYLKAAIERYPPFYYNKSQEFITKIENLISENTYDIVFTDTLKMDVYSMNINHSNKVISLHDSISLLYKTFRINTKNIFYKTYFQFCSYIYKRKELEILNYYTKSIFVSGKDEKYLIRGSSISSSTYVIPNGVNEDLIINKNNLISDPNIMVFSGIMDYKPNIDAVVYFVNEILPIILHKRANIKLYIIGKNPTKVVRKLANANIIVSGWVDDISEHICKGLIYVSPLISGAGLKNKILEAMALRRSIVATTISIDGLMLKDNVHLYVADTPNLFAEKVLELLRNDKKREEMIYNSYDLILNEYRWKKVLQIYEDKIFN